MVRAAGARAGTAGAAVAAGERDGVFAPAESEASAPGAASHAGSNASHAPADASRDAEEQAAGDADSADGEQPSVESTLERHADEAAGLLAALDVPTEG